MSSPVWAYFQKEEHGVRCMAERCNIFLPRRGTHTSNMISHLRRHHPNCYAEIECRLRRPKVPPPTSSTSPVNIVHVNVMPVPQPVGPHHMIDTEIVRFVTRQNLPFSAVNDPFFRHLVAHAFSKERYIPKTDNFYATAALDRSAHGVAAPIVDQVGASVFAVSIDSRKATGGKDPNLHLLSIHFITDEFERRRHCCGVLDISESTVAHEIREKIQDLLEFTGLRMAQASAIISNGSISNRLVVEANDLISFQSVRENLEYATSMLCESQQIASVLHKNRTFAQLLASNSATADIFKNYQLELNLAPELIPMGENHHWHSTVEQLKIVEKSIIAIRKTLAAVNCTSSDESICAQYTDADANLIRGLLKVLRPLESLMDMMSSPDSSCSMIIVSYHVLLLHLRDTLHLRETSAFNESVEHLIYNIESQSDIHRVSKFVCCASLLDPRFLFTTEQILKKNLLDCADDFLEIYKTHQGNSDYQFDEDEDVKFEPSPSSSQAAVDTYSFWDTPVIHNERPSESLHQTIEMELLSYRQMVERDPLDRKASPTLWYQRNLNALPILSDIVKIVHAPTASTMSSDAVFTKIDRALSSCLRTELSSVQVRQYLLLAIHGLGEGQEDKLDDWFPCVKTISSVPVITFE